MHMHEYVKHHPCNLFFCSFLPLVCLSSSSFLLSFFSFRFLRTSACLSSSLHDSRYPISTAKIVLFRVYIHLNRMSLSSRLHRNHHLVSICDFDDSPFSLQSLYSSSASLILFFSLTFSSLSFQELFRENLVRGRGLLARSIIRAQMASPGFTNVYASLLSIVNSRLPEIGELVLKRVILQFR